MYLKQAEGLPEDPEVFGQRLDDALQIWKGAGKRGIWLKVRVWVSEWVIDRGI